jgi:hypothetical protein
MKSYSQAGQDVFVRLIYGPDFKGTFLDIGCAGDLYSNTKALEEEGWTGTLVDIDPYAGHGRKEPFICGDATKCVFNFLSKRIDYLSLDVDENSLAALKNLPLDTTRFSVITIEHDAYRFGDKLWPGEREILKAKGYSLVCQDVCGAPGAPFEDWWVDTRNIHPSAVRRFLSVGKLYTDILYAAEVTTADLL